MEKVNEKNKENMSALERAKHVDLITLPKEIKGTNCGNCKFFNVEKSFCDHYEVAQEVKTNMCCKEWFAEGAIRTWEKKSENMETEFKKFENFLNEDHNFSKKVGDAMTKAMKDYFNELTKIGNSDEIKLFKVTLTDIDQKLQALRTKTLGN